MRWRWVLLATLTLVGCGADTAPSEATFFFPRHNSPLGAGDAALLEGMAVYGDGCLWIETEDEAPAEMAAELVGAIPERCVADRFWAVGDVLKRP